MRQPSPRIDAAMSDIRYREAEAGDLRAIVAMLADDMLGAGREDVSTPLAPAYLAAFEAIRADPRQHLIVAVDGDEPIGTLQISLIPGLSNQGAWRGQIEAVRIAGGRRGEKLGERLVQWAVAYCAEHGCASVQLTTNRKRVDAHRFYERLGFEPSHFGYKMTIPPR